MVLRILLVKFRSQTFKLQFQAKVKTSKASKPELPQHLNNLIRELFSKMGS
jgi:hypothetical protein